MKPKIYVAGKLNDMACDYIKNMHKMIHAAKQIRDFGGAVYVPCVDFLEGLVSGQFEYEDYFNNSQPFLEICDAVYVCKGYETSKGTLREIKLAVEKKIPVFFNLVELYHWIQKD